MDFLPSIFGMPFALYSIRHSSLIQTSAFRFPTSAFPLPNSLICPLTSVLCQLAMRHALCAANPQSAFRNPQSKNSHFRIPTSDFIHLCPLSSAIRSLLMRYAFSIPTSALRPPTSVLCHQSSVLCLCAMPFALCAANWQSEIHNHCNSIWAPLLFYLLMTLSLNMHKATCLHAKVFL